MNTPYQAPTRASAQPLTDISVHDAAFHLIELMRSLIERLDVETNLIKAGKLVDAAAHAHEKQAASDAYIALVSRMRPQLDRLNDEVPEAADILRGLHEDLHDALAFNLAVVATARDVTEHLVRAVAETIGSKTRASTYSARGAMPKMAVKASGIALDRAL